MEIAFVGTRGIPTRYGGFETAVEAIATRVVDAGADTVVYCRNAPDPQPSYRGVRLVHLPAVRRRSLETITHTFLSVLHLLIHPVDVVVLFNGANAFLVPLLRLRGMPVSVHVDGLEWQRAKWSWPGRTWHRLGERAAVRFGSVVVADAPGIARYYRQRHGADTVLLSYGAPILEDIGSDALADLAVEPDAYHLVVARFEPENHVEMIVRGYVSSAARLPLVVVGQGVFGVTHSRAITAAASGDPRVRFVGAVWDQRLLDQLYANARSYIHGHSVGGTNPSLLRAMGAGTAVIAYDVTFNRDIVQANGWYFSTPDEVRVAVEFVEHAAGEAAAAGAAGQTYVAEAYRWDDVAAGYLAMCDALQRGRTTTITGGAGD